jgi:hypothetical protein
MLFMYQARDLIQEHPQISQFSSPRRAAHPRIPRRRIINVIRFFPTDSPVLQVRIIYTNRLCKRIDETDQPVWEGFLARAEAFTQNDVQLSTGSRIFHHAEKVTAARYSVMNFR